MAPVKPSEIFDAAIEVLETYGWVQHSLGNDKYGYCALGAIYRARGLLDGKDATLPGPAADVFEDITEWNDKPERTADEVILAFAHLRDKLRREGK